MEDPGITNERQSLTPTAHADTPLRIEIDVRTGRTFHATRDIPAHSTVLASSTPYAYTIWKQFRNEVCAKCWRYDGGRKSFLTRRDDQGLADNCEGNRVGQMQPDTMIAGAGLWFCDEQCQAAWFRREGLDTFQLLRTLEASRSKKEKATVAGNREARETPDMSRGTIEKAWQAIRDKGRIPKEVKKWASIQLDNFETDMARYVLIALTHLCRERYRPSQAGDQDLGTPVKDMRSADDLPVGRSRTIEFGGATWEDFASLQPNELQHLQTYPELLENQIRVYQALKGRFTRAAAVDQRSARPTNVDREQVTERDSGGRGEERHHGGIQNRLGAHEIRNLNDVITIENVRTALSVDPGNSFGIWEIPVTDESECLGFAVYPRPSFFNHHCAPNVSKARAGRALNFVTTRPIRAGEEVCISYGHVEEMGWRERQKELKEGWFFECRCSRCTAEMEQDER